MPKSFKEYTRAKDKRVDELFGWGKKPQPQQAPVGQKRPPFNIPVKNPSNPNPFDKVQNLLLNLSNSLRELPGGDYRLNADSMKKFADKIQVAKEKYDRQLGNSFGSDPRNPRRDAERAANRQPNSAFDFSQPDSATPSRPVSPSASNQDFVSGAMSRHPRRDAERAANRQPNSDFDWGAIDDKRNRDFGNSFGPSTAGDREKERADRRKSNSHFDFDRLNDRENRKYGDSFGPSSDGQRAKDRAKRNAPNSNFDWDKQRRDELENTPAMKAYRKARKDSEDYANSLH